MSTSPNFTNTPRSSTVSVSAANTNRDGTGTLVTVMTGVASGTLVEQITICGASSTTGDNIIRLYYTDTSVSATNYLLDEIMTPATTASSSTPTYSVVLPVRIVLPNATSILKASIHVAETFTINATGGDF